MKSVTGWLSPNTSATNESGFSALPGGFRNGSGYFFWIGEYGDWWSSPENSPTDAWYRRLSYYSGNLGSSSSSTEIGFSVRCVRDY